MASISLAAEGRLVNSKYTGNGKNIILATLCVCSAPFSFGFAIGFTSPALPEMEWRGVMTSGDLSWFVSLLTLGAMAGCFLAGCALESIGRKRTMMVTTLPLALGWSLIASGASTWTFLLGRTLTGVAVGMISAAVPIYIAEIAGKENRGLLGSCNQLSITIGILGVYGMGWALDWQMLAWMGVIMPVVSNFLIAMIPETPRWLLMKGRKAEAKQAIVWLKGPYIDVENELNDLEENIDTKEKVLLSEFSKPELYMPLRVACLIMVFQQFMGINAIMFYAVTIFQQAEIFTLNGSLAAVIIGAIQVVATMFSCVLMDKAGRRKLLIFAGIGMMISCFVFGCHYLGVTPKTPGSPFLPVICLMVYMVSFSLGWGPIPMLLASEVFPQKARGMSNSMCVLTNWSCAFLVTKLFIPLSSLIGYHGIFWVFAVFCFLAVVYVFKFVPETKGKSLEDIELYFLGKSLHSSRERMI